MLKLICRRPSSPTESPSEAAAVTGFNNYYFKEQIIMKQYGIFQKNWRIGKTFATREDAEAKWNNYKWIFSGAEVREIEQIQISQDHSR